MLEKKLNVVDLGLMKYKDVLDIQETLAEARGRKEIHDTLVFVEHPATITRGIRAKDGEIRADDKELERLDIEVYNIERGGATFLHCPGQVVGYPIRLSNPENKDNFTKLIKEMGIYDYFSQINYSRLSSAIIKNDINISKEILGKVKIIKDFRVVLMDRGV